MFKLFYDLNGLIFSIIYSIICKTSDFAGLSVRKVMDIKFTVILENDSVSIGMTG